MTSRFSFHDVWMTSFCDDLSLEFGILVIFYNAFDIINNGHLREGEGKGGSEGEKERDSELFLLQKHFLCITYYRWFCKPGCHIPFMHAFCALHHFNFGSTYVDIYVQSVPEI